MNSQTTGQTDDRPCCSEPECQSGLRNNYYEGKRLSVDSFRIEQNYSLERRRLLNRAIHGWGVVCGFSISIDPPKNSGPGRLAIGPGLALDRCGRELVQTNAPVPIGDVIVLSEDGKPIKDQSGQSTSTTLKIDSQKQDDGDEPNSAAGDWWLLSVHYAERKVEPVQVDSSCRCQHHEFDRTCETIRYSLRPSPRSECFEKDSEGTLDCHCAAKPCEKCLCEHLTQLGGLIDPEGCECRMATVECNRVWVDLKNGVPIACVQLIPTSRNCWKVGHIETCGPRRLVKRNDLLFDLIPGCGLTRISEIGWREWHRTERLMPFDEFASAVGHDIGYPREPHNTGFWVKFSHPVRIETLRPDCFAMTVLSREQRTGWWEPFRVPIVDVDWRPTPHYPSQSDDPPDCVRGARMVFDTRWINDEVTRGNSLFAARDPTLVELEVRGDFILDCNGKAVDANAVGRAFSPTGNGTPGGVFLSTFRVDSAPESSRYYGPAQSS